MLHERALIKSEGWIGAHNPLATLEIEQERLAMLPTQPSLTGNNVALHLWLDREVRGEYSRIPLYLMHKLAVDSGVPFEQIPTDNPQLVLPKELMTIARNLAGYVWHGNDLQMTPESKALLKQRYIHHSDHYLQLGPLYPFRPAQDGHRAVYPNKGRRVDGEYYEY